MSALIHRGRQHTDVPSLAWFGCSSTATARLATVQDADSVASATASPTQHFAKEVHERSKWHSDPEPALRGHKCCRACSRTPTLCCYPSRCWPWSHEGCHTQTTCPFLGLTGPGPTASPQKLLQTSIFLKKKTNPGD